MLKRNCPYCDAEIKYRNEKSYKFAIKNESVCRSCSGKINTWNIRLKNGEAKNPFLDKNHSKEAIQKMRDSRASRSEKYKTDEFRKNVSKVTSGERNPMYGKNLMDTWIEKYGLEEALKKEKRRKQKLSKAFSGDKNPMYGRETPKKSGKGISGWYGSFYFRSLHELKFIISCERFGLEILSAEDLKIPYKNYDGTDRTYSPDFIVDNNFLVEVKPKKLFKTPSNLLKFDSAKKYALENNLIFKVLDFGIILKDELNRLIESQAVKLNVEYDL